MTKEELAKLFKSLDLEVFIDGCGCCGSPVVTITYKGEKIVDQENFCFDTKDYDDEVSV